MKTKLTLLILFAGLLFSSCSKYPPSSIRLTEDLVIYTKYDTSTSFSKFHTFYISDTIKWIDSHDSGYYTDSKAQSVLNQITQNMTIRGYQKVTLNNNPDLAFMVVVVKNVNATVYYPGWYWGYPGYYPPWYWGGSGYYYPYYPAYITTYTTGTLMIDMADLTTLSVDSKIWIRWNVYIRALMTGDHTIGQIQQCIDQAFNQTKGFSVN